MDPLTPELEHFIHSLPKAELHVHLEGAIEPETVLTLAQRHAMEERLPARDAAGLRQWFSYRDFGTFLEIYMVIQDLLRTREDFALIAYENGADMARQNICYRELTFTPYTHVHFQRKGVRIEDILLGLEEGRQRAKADFGVEMRWVFDISRNLSFPDNGMLRYDPEPGIRTLDYALQGRDYGVVALGIGGYEPTAPGRYFRAVFDAAQAAGLPCVPHAGENDGAQSVWDAINLLHADRVGHGVRAWEDPTLVRELAARRIPLEICPTSNIQLKVYPAYADHPFRRLDEAGVIVTVNSDDPPLFNANLTQEYRVLAQHFGYGKSDLVRIARNAFLHSLAEPGTKARLLAEFDAWVAAQETGKQEAAGV
ncbi:MAG: adenosine deaminase [Anaerolineae bacterium]|nr:adenosine deaminase [Anaerolineae bacterium]